MNKKGEANSALGVLLIVFVAIVLIMAFMQPIADTTKSMTSKLTQTDELINIASARTGLDNGINTSRNFTITNYPTGWKLNNGCTLENSTIVYSNSTNSSLTNMVQGTDYLVTPTGVLVLFNTTSMRSSLSNSTYIDYAYCSDGYNTDGSSRTVAGLIVLFSALALLSVVIGAIKLKDMFD